MKVIEMLKATDAKKEAKHAGYQALADNVRIREDEYEYEDAIEDSSQRIKFGSISIKTTEPIDKFAQWTPEELTAGIAKMKQTTIDSKQMKRREDAIRYIEKWFYEIGIPFNTATLSSFRQMLIAVKIFGEMLDAPSRHEISETFLEKEVDETHESLKLFKESCVVNRCTLITVVGSDRKNKSLMNIVAYCSARIAFLY